MVEGNLKRTFSAGEWEKGVAIKYNVIIVEKVCLSKYKVATKTKKMLERKIIQTANISYSTLYGNFRRLKCFVGGNVLSVEMFRRWKFRHFAKFSSFSTDEIV